MYYYALQPVRIVSGALCLVFAALLTTRTEAQTVYRWRDNEDRLQLSDRPPVGASALDVQALETDSRSGGSAQGLRAGERALLQTYRQRMQQRRNASRTMRARNDRDRKQAGGRCRQHREQWRNADGHDKKRPHAIYLRRHCW